MNILITAIGSMSADSVISSLRRTTSNNIIGCDIYPKNWIPAAADVDYFFQVPKAYEDSYIPYLLNICKEHDIEFVFPLTDPEVDVFNNYTEKFNNIGTTICISNPHSIEIARNKLKLYDFFKDSSLINPIPTFTIEKIPSSFYKKKMIGKIVNGRSSEGLQVIHKVEELQVRDYTDYVFQPYIIGDVFTVDLIRDIEGNSFSISRKELLRTKNGAGLTVEITQNETLQEMVVEIGNKLEILGCINVEFLFDGSRYYLMDINPRFSAGLAFSMKCGYDFVVNTLKCFNKNEIDRPIQISQRIYCKKYVEVFCD